jgi:hypothetical protein
MPKEVLMHLVVITEVLISAACGVYILKSLLNR